MRLSNRSVDSRSNKIELSMTSMIDVVFLLLIFFLVTTTFVRPEKQLLSQIKVQEKNTEDSSSDLEPAIVEILGPTDRVRYRLGGVITNELEEIERVLETFQNKMDGAFIKVDNDVPFDHVAQAIAACKRSGFSIVSYLPAK